MQLEVPYEVLCPYCNSGFTTFVDTSVPNQQYTEDCQICCKPILFSVAAKPGYVLQVTVDPE